MIHLSLGVYFVLSWRLLTIYIRLIGFSIYLILMFFYLSTSLINPGICLSKTQEKNYNLINLSNNGRKFCVKCNLDFDRYDHVVHCYNCNVCIIGKFIYKKGFDHHCPWMSKCIGKNNICQFRWMLITAGVLIVFLFYGLYSLKNEVKII